MHTDILPDRFSRFSPIIRKAADANPRTGFHATAPDDGRLIIQLTARPFARCQGCDQQLAEDRPLPATWLDDRTGDPNGAWDHQHGCGTWNSPTETIVELPADIFDDDFDDDTAWDIVEADVADGIRALERAVDDEIADEVEVITGRLRNALAAAVADPDDETLITGRDDQPGVWRDDAGRLEAWDYHPGWHDGETPTIAVTEDDL